MILKNKNRAGLRANASGLNRSIFIKDPNISALNTNTKFTFHITYSHNNDNTTAVTGYDYINLWTSGSATNDVNSFIGIYLDHNGSNPKSIIFQINGQAGWPNFLQYGIALPTNFGIKDVSYVTFTFDGTTSTDNAKWYLNGELYGIASINPATYGNILWNNKPLFNYRNILGDTNAPYEWDLVLYEQQIFDDVLTNIEIKELVKADNTPSSSVLSKMISWYDYNKKTITPQFEEIEIEKGLKLHSAVFLNGDQLREILTRTETSPNATYTYGGSDLNVTDIILLFYTKNLLDYNLLNGLNANEFRVYATPGTMFTVNSYVVLNEDQLRKVTNISGNIFGWTCTYTGSDLTTSPGITSAVIIGTAALSYINATGNSFDILSTSPYIIGSKLIINETIIRTITNVITITPSVQYQYIFDGAPIALSSVDIIPTLPTMTNTIIDTGTNEFSVNYESSTNFFAPYRLSDNTILINDTEYRTLDYISETIDGIAYNVSPASASPITSVKIKVCSIQNKVGSGQIWLNKTLFREESNGTQAIKFLSYKGGAWVDKDYNIAE